MPRTRSLPPHGRSLSPPEYLAAQPRVSGLIKVTATLVSAAVIIAGLYFGQDLLIPFAIAILISFALNPAVAWLGRLGMPRVGSVLIVLALMLGLVGGLLFVLATQVRALSAELPTYQTTIREKIADLRSSMTSPGMLDGALQTVDIVQREVEAAEAQAEAREDIQRVEMVPAPQSPFDMAMTWLGRSADPLATAGIILIFIFLALLDRSDLRDRFLRMLGGNLHRSTDAIEEAGARISRYLLMQLLVNVTYGVPMALGLWVIGVPGALLWGVVATVLRFVPYVGPVISALFPLTLAFAVDPGWNMVLWTAALIVGLELVSNNVVEPLLYGSSTGLSVMSLIAAAMFWTALWGPVGLILSTPLTVCLLVLGRNLPQLQFLEILLGATPVLDLPTRIYQRLIADDVDEAVEIAEAEIEEGSVTDFYNDVGIPVLRLASEDYLHSATAEHRLRFANGMDDMLEELQEHYPPREPAPDKPAVICIGGKWEIDAMASVMLAHALSLEGVSAATRPLKARSSEPAALPELDDAKVICLSFFSASPVMSARVLCRRLHRRWPGVRIVLAFWNAPADILTDEMLEQLGADEVVTSMEEAVLRLQRMVSPGDARVIQRPERPENEQERVKALHQSGLLEDRYREQLDAIAKRAADVFDVRLAIVTVVAEDEERIIAQSGPLPRSLVDDGNRPRMLPRDDAICSYVVADGQTLSIADLERDPRFADNPAIEASGLRFYTGAPLRVGKDLVLGAICILDTKPRALDADEIELLETMAADVMELVGAPTQKEPARGKDADSDGATATVGQKVPD